MVNRVLKSIYAHLNWSPTLQIGPTKHAELHKFYEILFLQPPTKFEFEAKNRGEFQNKQIIKLWLVLIFGLWGFLQHALMEMETKVTICVSFI